jgi:hypothetical protein
MHNGEPQFDNPNGFSVPVGSKRVSQEEWDRIFPRDPPPKPARQSKKKS